MTLAETLKKVAEQLRQKSAEDKVQRLEKKALLANALLGLELLARKVIR